jgi:hypothetical protein
MRVAPRSVLLADTAKLFVECCCCSRSVLLAGATNIRMEQRQLQESSMRVDTFFTNHLHDLAQPSICFLTLLAPSFKLQIISPEPSSCYTLAHTRTIIS